jgi:plasmid stabilization system protein ParE
MERRISWTEIAEQDLFSILQFWLHHNQSASYPNQLERWVGEALDLLIKLPQMGPLQTSNQIRYILIDRHFKLIYTLTDEEITVLRFWDTRQDPGNLSTPTA